MKVADIRRHGDFGLGTFDSLDGEGIMLDGRCWQARGDGSVIEAPDDAEAQTQQGAANLPAAPRGPSMACLS